MQQPHVNLFTELHLDKPKQIQEFTNKMRLIHIDNGKKVPVIKNGMFILLSGQIKVTTHWKLENGMNPVQKNY